MPQQKNEGEGNRTAARRYNKGAQRRAEEGVGETPEALSEDDRRALEQAEERAQENSAKPAALRVRSEVDPGLDRPAVGAPASERRARGIAEQRTILLGDEPRVHPGLVAGEPSSHFLRVGGRPPRS